MTRFFPKGASSFKIVPICGLNITYSTSPLQNLKGIDDIRNEISRNIK